MIVSQAHADIVGIKHWLKTVSGEGTDLTPVKQRRHLIVKKMEQLDMSYNLYHPYRYIMIALPCHLLHIHLSNVPTESVSPKKSIFFKILLELFFLCGSFLFYDKEF